MPVRLIIRIQTRFTALCLGKVSYLVFRVILVIALHELDKNLIFNCILNALNNNLIFAIVVPSLFFPLGRINEIPDCVVFIIIGSLLFQ